MKCPYCGYDKIQPNFSFCPSCEKPLNETANTMKTPHALQQNPNLHEKGFINRAISRWTYERAIADPYSYAIWAYKNPNDNRYFLNKWKNEGNDTTIIRNAIAEANRARQENPTIDSADVASSIIDANQQGSRRQANNAFVEAVNAAPTTDAAAIVRNKAIWKLQQGELARHIAPDEWQYVAEHLSGIVIEEGTSAIIYIDGQEVAQMGSGMYVFDDKHAEAAEIEAQNRENEHKGFLSRLRDNLYRFFTGHKREESTSERNARRRRVQDIMARLKKDTIIDVYLKSDRIFPAIFGQQHLADSADGYQPYVMQSRYLDVQVGVSMQMQIGDFKEFITNFMAGYKTVRISDVVKSLDGAVYSILKFRLRDVEISERGLDEYTFNAIKSHLMTNLPNLLHGVNIVDILDIATTNEQLARFRQVEERIYCIEHEYDYLKRTNEFRNRIAAEENDQKIREASSEQELRNRLDELNKDKLLHEDEMEQFVSLLMNQKAIREATNHADLDRAMTEIQRNRLITREEFDAFQEDFNNRRFERSQVSEQLRAKSLMATALAKLEVDKILNIANIQNAEAISEAEFEAFKKGKGREAEGWDLETAIYGRQYVYENQKLLAEQDLKRKQNAFSIEEAKHQSQLNAIGRDETRQDVALEHEQILAGHKVASTIRDDEYEHSVRVTKDNLGFEETKINMSLNAQARQTDIHLTHAERMSKIAMQNMQAMQEAELNILKEKHAHEEKVTTIEADVTKTQIEAEKTMAADQLMAKNIGTMDAAAQAKFAESFSHLNEAELIKQNAEQQKELYEKMIKMAEANNISVQGIYTTNANQQMLIMQQMMQAFATMNISANSGQQNVVNSMLGVMQNFANTRINDAKDIKEEYRGQMHHEQERVDKNTEQSLNYTTRVKMSENMPHYTAGGTSVNVNVGNKRNCPNCGQLLDDTMNICPICGTEVK
jgi:hypothetical protein